MGTITVFFGLFVEMVLYLHIFNINQIVISSLVQSGDGKGGMKNGQGLVWELEILFPLVVGAVGLFQCKLGWLCHHPSLRCVLLLCFHSKDMEYCLPEQRMKSFLSQVLLSLFT